MSYKPLPPEQITIQISDEMMMIVQGKTKGSHLAYHACGLQIYKIGQSAYHHPDCISNMVKNACEARRIPLTSLREVFTNTPRKSSFSTETRPMFGDE